MPINNHTPNGTPLDQLRNFLNKLFQFETQDLDFGVYKILNYKRKETKEFIDDLLVNTVKSQLVTLTDKQIQKAQEEMDKLVKETIVSAWLRADPGERKTLEKYGWDTIKQYLYYADQMETAQAASDTENQIYNHLALFFSRYYDKGDFISKRRFGKNEKYMVPYNGEETHFYWANHDQYYIKSSETFKKFSFKAGPYKGSRIINFKLTEARTEQGNVKADENKYFILSDQEPAQTDDELTIFFEYRPLTDDEKKTTGSRNIQDRLNEQAAAGLEAALRQNPSLTALWDRENEETLLLKKLHHYTRKNQYDFFIHKNLKAFLQRELDFYIKSELLNVDDLYVSETELHLTAVKRNFKKIKVFKQIADTIIDFLAQIENFQKKLWEKKKFVVNTEWVITIDRLVAYLGKDAAMPIIDEVLQNNAQTAEWADLFGKKIIPGGKMTIDGLRSDLFSWPKLPIDTVHFSIAFKENLLNLLSEKIDLEDTADGLVIHSDNYHGLVLLNEKFNNRVKCIYIDPPYNTDASEIIYKNGYKVSSWVTLINDRLIECKKLMQKDGILCATIDDFQQRELYSLLKENFSKEGMLGTVVIRNNPSGRPIPSGFGISHEYGLFVSKSPDAIVGKFERTENQNKRYSFKDNQGFFMWELLRKRGSNSRREDARKSYFPFYVSESAIRLPSLSWDDNKQLWVELEKPCAGEEIIYPIDENGVERNWRWGIDTAKKNVSELKAERKNGFVIIYYKYRMPIGIIPSTNWIDSKYSSTEHGTGVLKTLFTEYNPFSYPKSIFAVKDSLSISIGDPAPNHYVLDYFAGSGTTFHATQILNHENSVNSKCILIEQGDYVYTVILPRIKKIAYTFDWKDGEPKDAGMNGLGVFFKYQRLEQYEESLENIAFTVSEETAQKALSFDQYIPKYFLEFETRGSQTLVNTEAMQNPWAYELKVWNGLTYDTRQPVDLVETFNYLIGLHMQKCFTRDIKGRKYQFISGAANGGKQLAVVWRDQKNWEPADFEADRDILKEVLPSLTYDVLYINGQAIMDGYQPIEEIFKNKMLP